MDVEQEIEVIVGTYEDYVVGYRVELAQERANKRVKTANDNQSEKYLPSLEQSFAVRCHSGSVKCLTASSDGTKVLSAGHDEMLNLLSLKRRKLLQTSEGAINCATYVGNFHSICGSEDGNIYIYECKGSDMNLTKTMKGHKSAIISLSAHPSGKVLLSLSKDNTMRTWNLIKGRCAYVTNIKSQAHSVLWTKSGDGFMIAANNEIYLYNNSGILEHSIKLEKRINSVEFINEDVFVVATDSGKLEFFDLKKGVSLMKQEAHETRIKCVKCLGDSQIGVLLVTASSDGLIKLWSLTDPGYKLPLELASTDTGARLTCMTSTVHNVR